MKFWNCLSGSVFLIVYELVTLNLSCYGYHKLGKFPLQPCKTKNDTTCDSIGEFGKLPLQPGKTKKSDNTTASASSDGFRELSIFL